jgi:alkaline phosphatase
MNRRLQVGRYVAWALVLCFASAGTVKAGGNQSGAMPRNVILLIGDGMGFAQMQAASLYAHGDKGKLFLQTLPAEAKVRTYPASGPKSTTDSAAAGTAFAAGRKVKNGVLSLAIPGDYSRLETVLEIAARRGKRTGLVTTTSLTHATPASFAAHVPSRNSYDRIAEQMLNDARPNVLFGGSGAKRKQDDRIIVGLTPEKAAKAGYVVVKDRKAMEALSDRVEHAAGLFHPDGHMPYYYDDVSGEANVYQTAPRLFEMTRKALSILDSGSKGFFLMVEGGRIDHAGHDNHIQRNIHETLEFDRTVKAVMDWAKGREDTLVIVTADHECGGLRVEKTDTPKGQVPQVSWASGGHTNLFVPLYAWGPGSQRVGDLMENTDVYRLMVGQAFSPRKVSQIPADEVPHLPPAKKKAPAGAGAYGS